MAWELGKQLLIEEVDMAPPKKMEVRLKILYAFLCYTNIYFWEAKDCGGGVTELALGDHVIHVLTANQKKQYVQPLTD
uniref:alcohol dehydrogenase n=1 Tax=Nicotiana sylvestris TaxID=4096 RepID=A0A1U7X6Q2_NICSY|nr:PREDICTED: alcohol dehydrogenase 3-like [Nicotiana sylvestris]